MMRRPELDHVLNTMLESQPEVSDLLFTVDKPLQVESFGELKPVTQRADDEPCFGGARTAAAEEA